MPFLVEQRRKSELGVETLRLVVNRMRVDAEDAEFVGNANGGDSASANKSRPSPSPRAIDRLKPRKTIGTGCFCNFFAR